MRGNVEDRQAKVLTVWLNNPMDSFRDIASKAGISEETFARYRKDPAFMANYERMCREWFKSLQGLAINTIRRAAEEGNWQAGKYILDCADYQPTTKVDLSTNEIKIKIDGSEE